MSERSYLAVWGDFEPVIVAGYEDADLNQQNSVREVVSQFGQTEYSNKTEEYSIGIEGATLTGGTYWLGYTLERSSSSLTDVDEYTSFGGITVEQPLLKGALGGTPLVRLRIARRERRIAYEEYRKSLMEVISQVESAYWNLAFAQELHLLAADSLEIARKLLTDTEAQVKAGRLTTTDLLEAESGLLLRETYLKDTEQQIWDARTEIRILLADAPGLPYDELNAADPLMPTDSERKPVSELLQWSLIAQPDYLIRLIELELEELAVDYYRGQLLPELNVKGSFGLNGIGPTAEESLAKVNEQDYPTWSLSAEVRIPLTLGIKERNELEVAKYKQQIAEKKISSAAFEIERSLEILSRRISTFDIQIADTRSVSFLKEQQLELQQTLLKAGKSTSRALYQVEDDLSQARQRVIELILRAREAIMQLKFISGSVLRDFGLETAIGDEVMLADYLVGLRKP
jgi:outer membrane protein TolC